MIFNHPTVAFLSLFSIQKNLNILHKYSEKFFYFFSKNLLTNDRRCAIIQSERGSEKVPKRKEIITMINKIDFDSYCQIADMLTLTDSCGNPIYSVEKIAQMMVVSVDTVLWVDREENGDN